MNMSTANVGTVDNRTVVVVVAGTEYRCTPEQAAYVNDDSAPCHVVIRSPEHLGGGSLPPVYKGTGIKRDRERVLVEKRSRLEWSEQTHREMMLDKDIPPEMVDKLTAAYGAVRTSIEHTSGKTLYKWTGGLVDKVCAVPNASVRAFISVLTENMPQPTVQAIRDQVVHGQGVEPLYTQEMSSVLAFTIWWTTPYTERKIRAFENERVGMVSGRTLHRTTDIGQQGRLFSESDISDLVNRTILMAFCPVICRAVPVTDKGTGFLVLNKCTAKMEVGECQMMATRNKSTLCGREETLKRRFKKYRCTEEQWLAANTTERRKLITVQMYNQAMAELPSMFSIENRERRQKHSEGMRTRKGWWVVYTCSETGQKFRVFTQSLSRAERLCSYTGITAALQGSVLDENTAGLFGTGQEQAVVLESTSVTRYTPHGVYFKTLKFMIYTIYEYLFRRSIDIDSSGCLNDHRTTKMARKNYAVDFSLHELWEQMEYGRKFTNEQADIIDVELTLPENLPQAKSGYRRTAMYRDLVYKRTGHECTISRWDYEKLKERVFSELKAIWEADTAVQPVAPVQMFNGGGLFYRPSNCHVDGVYPVTAQNYTDDQTIVVIPPAVLAFGGNVYTEEIEVSGLVKRTAEEIELLDRNPAVRKYSNYKTVHVAIPCWRSVDGDHLYIEQNHDDV
jgi:hypothetical protein